MFLKRGKKKRIKNVLSLLEAVPVRTTKTIQIFQPPTVNILGSSIRTLIHIHSTITGIQANNKDTRVP